MSDTPRIELKTLDDLQPDPNNINKHTVRGHQVVENSLRKRGAFRSVAAAGKGVERPVIYAGNLTAEKARDAGINDTIFVHTTGDKLVVVVRDDIEPGSPEAVALGIEDNEAAHVSYNPDLDIMAAMTAGAQALLTDLMKQDDVFTSLLRQVDAPYAPNLEPGLSNKQVTDADVVKTEGDLENKFSGDDSDALYKVLCPHCASEFYIRKDAVYD